MIILVVSNFLGMMMAGAGLSMLWVSIGLIMADLSIFIEWELFSNYSFSFIFLFLLDWVSLSFGGLVLMISGMVVIYSGNYMGQDMNLFRFLMILILFVASMILMIFSPNLVSILLGWDGLGLVSYCLVIYYQNVKSLNAGLLTILSNRVGDIAILLSISWLLNYGVWNFFLLEQMFNSSLLLILMLVMLAALTKSAQIPFSAWLPAAMAAPTPISALVHSSTLVTAGVYMMIRFSELLGTSSILFYLSVGTMFMSGLGANFEMDLKKIIALSTLSQLGVMMMSLSLGMMELAYFHLLMHALFKSLLFLCAGVFIHGFSDKQDIRSLGAVMESSPVSSFYLLGCSLALCGFPFMSGFYSKDLILEMWMMGNLNNLKIILIILATFFTITYSVRLLLLVTNKSGFLTRVVSSIESLETTTPMSILFIFAVVGGSTMGWYFLPMLMVNMSFLFKGLILMFLMLYTISQILWLASHMVKQFNTSYLTLVYLKFFSSLWWLSNMAINWLNYSKIGGAIFKMMDQGWVEEFGPQGVNKKISWTGMLVDKFTYMGFSKLMFAYIMIIMLILVSL